QPADRKLFDFNINDLDWKKYLESYVLGTREFILKESPSTLPVAQKQLRR
ncbi:MAG: acyl-CoA reductase C-terminal domain-containing protein, partial [Wolbachia sp.]